MSEMDDLKQMIEKQNEMMGKLTNKLETLETTTSEHKTQCPVCGEWFKNKYACLLHVVAKHPEWIVLEPPAGTEKTDTFKQTETQQSKWGIPQVDLFKIALVGGAILVVLIALAGVLL